MTRRCFFNTILKAGAGCMILPAAMTYQRNWRGTVIQEPDLPSINRWAVSYFDGIPLIVPIFYRRKMDTVVGSATLLI